VFDSRSGHNLIFLFCLKPKVPPLAVVLSSMTSWTPLNAIPAKCFCFSVSTSLRFKSSAVRSSYKIRRNDLYRFQNEPIRLTRVASSSSAASASSSRRRIWPTLMTVGGFAAGGGLAYSFSEREWTGKLESIYRSLSFYSVAVPRYLIYRYHLWRGSPDHVWESLHRETSDMALKKILG
jgi:hypothetical protein